MLIPLYDIALLCSVMSFFVWIQRLDNMARLPPAYCTKIFLQRDYSDGTAVRFQTKFPQELEGKVIFLCWFLHHMYRCTRLKAISGQRWVSQLPQYIFLHLF